VIGIQDRPGDELFRAYVTLKDGTQVDKQEYSSCAASIWRPTNAQDLEIRRNCPRIP